MASIWKHPESKYWHANFTLPGGGRTNRSTRETDAKKAAKIAEGYERAAQQRMTEGQIRRVISDLFERVSGTPLASATVREYFTGWLERKRMETGDRTADRYGDAVRPFLDLLGPRADTELMFVTVKDLTNFRDTQAKRLSVASANLGLKILRVGFAQAFRDGLINENPATRVSMIKRQGAASIRRAFTLPELQKLLAESSGEWRGLTYFGLYTGQRLGDLARLTWQNLHGLGTPAPELRLVTGKTGRQQIIPLAKPLLRYVEAELIAGDEPRAPLFPKIFQTIERQEGRTGSLSGQFYRLMADAGLVAVRSNARAKNGKGRSGPRATGELSFHCLRHTATSLMKNAGISPAIVQDIIGHDSSAVSAHYTHIEGAAKRVALDAMPDVAEVTNVQKSASKREKIS
jgi:integrase